ncbi:MAG: D-alanyl-D-alanine carboxypeptidase [Alphaproteobacteria bacterium]|nr:D-alanyl-D-alanine carboxypeptidase [Alphaproteobacteria bacterium]
MLKKVLFLLFFLLSVSPVFAVTSTLVADVQSGYVLQAKNADRKQYPASLTKVMTLYITFDALEKGVISMDDLLPVSKHAAAQPKSKLGLKEGSVISVKDAILALIVKSANDAAVVLAEGLAPSEEEFAVMMTRFAKDLGLTHTVFKNASGLHHPDQVSSAKDMAVLTIAMINHFPQYYPLFSTKSFSYNGTTYYSHNSILLYYNGAQGFKTGFIAAVGYNVISTAKRNGRTLVGVVIGENTAAKRDRKMRDLLDSAFAKAKKKEVELAKLGENPFLKKVFISKAHRDIYDPVLLKSVAQTRAKVSELTATGNQVLLASIPLSSYEDDTISIEQGDYAAAEWSIQIGAFASKEKAEKQALTAQDILNIKTTAVELPEINHLFRSRLSGFETKDDAKKACDILSNKSVPCFVIAPVVSLF